MAGFTKEQLNKQLVLIRQFYAGKLSSKDFNAKLSAMKAEQRIPNEERDKFFAARRKVDGWIGGEFQKKAYAGVRSACQSAGYNARGGPPGSYKKAFNIKWKELDGKIKAETKTKREKLQSCKTIAEITKLSISWGMGTSQTGARPKKVALLIDISFTRKSNGWYHPVDVGASQKLKDAGFVRFGNANAMVISPDGRLKAWRTTDTLKTVTKTLNGVKITLTRYGSYFGCQLTKPEMRSILD